MRAEKQRLEADPKTKFIKSKMLDNLGEVCGVLRKPQELDNDYFMRIKQTKKFASVQDEMWDVRLGEGATDFMKELKKL